MTPTPALTLAFVVVSALTLGSGLAMVTTPSVFHAALFMAAAFLGVAGLFVLLQAPFLAVAQILIYVGAIAVLMLFALMLTPRIMGGGGPSVNAQWPLALAVAVAVFLLLAAVAWLTPWGMPEAAPAPDDVNLLGSELLTTYLLPFEVAGVLLLVALVGAIVVAREGEE